VRADVVPLTDEREQQRTLLRVELRFPVGGGADQAAGGVVVVLGELARLPAPEPAWGNAELKGEG